MIKDSLCPDLEIRKNLTQNYIHRYCNSFVLDIIKIAKR